MAETDERLIWRIGSETMLTLERLGDFRGLTNLIADIRRHDADGWREIVLAVGTTALRVIESAPRPSPMERKE